MNVEVSASCDCGAVSFKSQDIPVLQVFCHCTNCQDATGEDCARLAFFKFETVKIEGLLLAHNFTASSGTSTARDACSSCGTLMFDRSAGFPKLVGVFAERMDKNFEFQPKGHVWVRSKKPTLEILDGLSQYQRNFGE